MPFVITKKLAFLGRILSKYPDKTKWPEEENANERNRGIEKEKEISNSLITLSTEL